MRLFIVAMFVTAALAGCTSPADGSASIYVKDAPTDDFSEIHVVFSKVDVHRAGGDDADEEDGDEADGNETDSDGNETDGNETDGNDTEQPAGAGWIVLFENATGQDIDLLAASGDQAAFLGEADLEAGKYTQIRIHVMEAYGIDHDGMRHDFKVPSGVLKLNQPFDVAGGEETRIILDYDLDRSIKGAAGSWRMTPVVGSVAVEQVDDEASGQDVHEEGEMHAVA